MKSIYEYLNYRKYILDYIKNRKKKEPSYGFYKFALDSGINQQGFIHNVAYGKRGLSRSASLKVAKALKLSSKESEYFDNLVAYNQTDSKREKKIYRERLKNIKRK